MLDFYSENRQVVPGASSLSNLSNNQPYQDVRLKRQSSMKKEDSTLPTISSSKQERGVDHLGYSTNYKGAGTSFMGNVFINRGNIHNKSQLSI